MTDIPALDRRRRERQDLLDRAGVFAAGLPSSLGLRAAVVIGSVARGDFNLWSDVDVIVVADRLPATLHERLSALGMPPPKVQPIAWTPAEYRRRRDRRDPMVVEAERCGVWLLGCAADVGPPTPAHDGPFG